MFPPKGPCLSFRFPWDYGRCSSAYCATVWICTCLRRCCSYSVVPFVGFFITVVIICGTAKKSMHIGARFSLEFATLFSFCHFILFLRYFAKNNSGKHSHTCCTSGSRRCLICHYMGNPLLKTSHCTVRNFTLLMLLKYLVEQLSNVTKGFNTDPAIRLRSALYVLIDEINSGETMFSVKVNKKKSTVEFAKNKKVFHTSFMPLSKLPLWALKA